MSVQVILAFGWNKFYSKSAKYQRRIRVGMWNWLCPDYDEIFSDVEPYWSLQVIVLSSIYPFNRDKNRENFDSQIVQDFLFVF